MNKFKTVARAVWFLTACALSWSPAFAEEFTRPQPIRIDPPEYPRKLAEDGIGGQVEVDYIITSRGTTTGLRISRSTHPGFEQTALAAVEKWTYRPGRKGTRLVNVRVAQRLEFFLQADRVYPFELLKGQITGRAEVDYLVDREGRARDIKVIEATRPEFGRALAANVAECTHAPDFEGVTPSGGRRRASATFGLTEKEGPVNAAGLRILKALRTGGGSFSDKKIEDLAKQPLKESYTFPEYVEAVEAMPGWARVVFYVDEKGEVQLPEAVEASHPDLGYAAAQIIKGIRCHPQKKSTPARGEATVRFSARGK